MSLWDCTTHFHPNESEDPVYCSIRPNPNPPPYLLDTPNKKNIKHIVIAVAATIVILINILILLVSLFLNKQISENLSSYYVYITEDDFNYHEADCELIMNHNLVAMDLSTALKLGYKQCPYCRDRIIYFSN